MPNIRTYDAGNLALRPTETGIEATAAAARRMGAFFNQVAGATQELGHETARLGAEKAGVIAGLGRKAGQDIAAGGEAYVKYQTHQDISRGAPALANYADQKTREWNETVKNADPNDPTIAAKFREGLEGDFEKLKGGFTTEASQLWAESHINTLRNHFFQTTASDMSTLARQAVKVNQQQTLNSLSSMVHGDPTALDTALGLYESKTRSVVASSPTMSGTDATGVTTELLQKGREAIVKSAAIGHIEKTGTVPAWATDPKYAPYINGAELKQFEKAAEAQTRSNLYYDRAAQSYKKQQDALKVDAEINRVWADNIEIDAATNRPIIKPNFFREVLDIARKYPDAPNAASTAKTYMNWGEQQLRARQVQTVSDAPTKQALVDRMFDPDKPTSVIDLMEAQLQGKLSDKDFGKLKGFVDYLDKAPLRDPVYKATQDGVKALLGTDPVGKGKYADFMADFMPRYLAEKRAGTAPPNALDLKDENSPIRQAMKPYQRSTTQILQDRVMRGEMPTPALPPKSELVDGQVYPTARGPARWDKKKDTFVTP